MFQGSSLRRPLPNSESQPTNRVHVCSSRALAHDGRAVRRADRARRRGDGRRDRAQAQDAARGGRGDRRVAHERGAAPRVLRGGDPGRQGGRRALLAPPQGDHDEDLGPDHVRPRCHRLLQGRLREARRDVRLARRQPEQRAWRRLRQDRVPARRAARRDRGRHHGDVRDAPQGRYGRLGPRHHQPPRAVRHHHRRLDPARHPRLGQDVDAGGHAPRLQGSSSRFFARTPTSARPLQRASQPRASKTATTTRSPRPSHSHARARR